MIIDNQALFSDAQAITVTAGSTNTIDFGPVSPLVKNLDFGKGEDVSLLVQVVTAFTSTTGDGTLAISLELDSTETFTPDRSIPLRTFTQAELVAGAQIWHDELPRGIKYQYGRLKYTVGGTDGAFLTGKITAGIVAGVQSNGVTI